MSKDEKRGVAVNPDKRGALWTSGMPSPNPGGKPSLHKDLERAGAINPELAGLTPEQARAKWWAMILPVAFAGPRGPKDSNWTYAAGEVGVRLLGKPKETIAVEGAGTAPIDWTKVPVEEREELLGAITKLQAYAGPIAED